MLLIHAHHFSCEEWTPRPQDRRVMLAIECAISDGGR